MSLYSRFLDGVSQSDQWDVMFVAFLSFLYLSALIYAYFSNQSWECVVNTVKTIWI